MSALYRVKWDRNDRLISHKKVADAFGVNDEAGRISGQILAIEDLGADGQVSRPFGRGIKTEWSPILLAQAIRFLFGHPRVVEVHLITDMELAVRRPTTPPPAKGAA